MNRIKISGALLALVMTFSMTACENRSSSDSVNESSSQSETAMTTTTTTTAMTSAEITTTETTQQEEETTPAPEHSIVCGNSFVRVKDDSGELQWVFGDKAVMGGKSRVSCSCNTEYFTCFLELTPESEFKSFVEREIQDSETQKTGILEYAGKKVKYQASLFKNGDSNDIRSFFIVLPVEKNYAVLSVTIGAQYTQELQNDSSVEDINKSFADWYNKNKGTAFSTDPKDYLYIFDSLELE